MHSRRLVTDDGRFDHGTRRAERGAGKREARRARRSVGHWRGTSAQGRRRGVASGPVLLHPIRAPLLHARAASPHFVLTPRARLFTDGRAAFFSTALSCGNYMRVFLRGFSVLYLIKIAVFLSHETRELRMSLVCAGYGMFLLFSFLQ